MWFVVEQDAYIDCMKVIKSRMLSTACQVMCLENTW